MTFSLAGEGKAVMFKYIYISRMNICLMFEATQPNCESLAGVFISVNTATIVAKLHISQNFYKCLVLTEHIIV